LTFLFALFLIVLFALCACRGCSERIKVWVGKISQKIFWNTQLRFIFEVYLELAVTSFIKLRLLAQQGTVLENASDKIDLAVFVVALLIATITPLFLAIFVYLKREKFNEERYRMNFGSIYEGIDLENQHAVYYMLVFTARRLFFAFVIVFLPS